MVNRTHGQDKREQEEVAILADRRDLRCIGLLAPMDVTSEDAQQMGGQQLNVLCARNAEDAQLCFI